MIVRRLLAVLVVGAALVAAFAYVDATEPGWYVRLRYPLHYDAIVRGHARNYRLDPALVAAVIYQESKFHVHARSSSGAIGLMQLLPATAKGIAIHTGGTRFQVSDLDDPEINVRYGAWYLRHLLDKYDDERTGAGRLQRGAGQRRPLEGGGEGDRLRRDAPLRQTSRASEDALPQGVPRATVRVILMFERHYA